ncbi:MAG: hypothetical protein SFU85_13835 [Candidatus Methylacidiphilales bacterium]|nr:hypothetical protein [Candidatus Methylacidiphilales bacterium]
MNLTPEHLHIALNHLPIVGIPIGLLILWVGTVFKTPPVQLTALGLIAAMALATAGVMYTGEEAEERFEKGLIQPALDGEGEGWLHEHEEAAEGLSWAIYLSGGLAVVLAVVLTRWPRFALPSVLVFSAWMIFVIVGTIRVAEAGGKIRHPEFRTGKALSPGTGQVE